MCMYHFCKALISCHSTMIMELAKVFRTCTLNLLRGGVGETKSIMFPFCHFLYFMGTVHVVTSKHIETK